LKSSSLRLAIALLLLWIPALAQGQLSPPRELILAPSEVQEPYLFPINPGMQNWLAGTMGELRNTHFHAGIDIRTDARTGLPVRATQKGYVSRVIVGTYGYGQALFITHPDGNVSVYGHLDRYNGKLAEFILNKHYELKSFDLDLSFAPSAFPVNRGDTVAFSGNTGGSAGPHLHFEIRDAQNEALNPLSFHFDEIKDVLPPVAQKIAIKTLAINARVDDQFGRKEFALVRAGNHYSPVQSIRATGRIGLEILAYDRLDFSRFRCGINEIEVLVDNEKVFSQKIDKINFDQTHGIVSMMDFEMLKTRGLHFNKLYVDDGNPLKFYEQSKNKGDLTVAERPVSVQINLIDTYRNKTEVHLSILPAAPPVTRTPVAVSPTSNYFVSGNILEIQVPCAGKEIKLFDKGQASTVGLAYSLTGHQVFLVDLQKTIPDSAQTCHGTIHFDVKDKVPSGIDYTFYSDWANVRFKANSLYDTLFMNLTYALKNGKSIYSIGRVTDPLSGPIDVTLKNPVVAKPDPKLAVYRMEGRSFTYIGGEWKNDLMTFKTAQLGDFVLLTDTVPPVIHRLACQPSSARFRAFDGLSGISKFEASIDGQWLLMTYDYKTGILQSVTPTPAGQLHGAFELRVTDQSGNQSVYKQNIP